MTFWKFLSSMIALAFVLFLKLRALLAVLGLGTIVLGATILYRRYDCGRSILPPALLTGAAAVISFVLAFALPNTRLLTLLFA